MPPAPSRATIRYRPTSSGSPAPSASNGSTYNPLPHPVPRILPKISHIIPYSPLPRTAQVAVHHLSPAHPDAILWPSRHRTGPVRRAVTSTP
ncbi:hypothetical protein JCM4814A_83310 [Streptomyces phaeofaciens JCM 4814]|uniref:Uncharacterized protein n=1 Tax=Streptomyces phaeofaciens TaxID=68254 RepID=A0A918LZE1_9ACTN|nr:hypothetical protein GCM10010226_71940 [Streptomyces phaeofaciens]